MAKRKKMEKTSYNLPPGLRKAFDVAATQRDTHMQEVVAVMIQKWIDDPGFLERSSTVYSEVSERARAAILLEAAGDSREIAQLDSILGPYINEVQKGASKKRSKKEDAA